MKPSEPHSLLFFFSGATSSYDSPSKKNFVEPTKEELQKIRESRLAQQSSDPFYLKESSSLTAKSPLRSNNNVISDIPVQNIELDVPLKIAGKF